MKSTHIEGIIFYLR